MTKRKTAARKPAPSEQLDTDCTPKPPDGTVDASTVTPRATNLYTDDDLRRVSEAIQAYHRITSEQRRHRDEWLTIIGPALVMVRTKVQEVTGIINVTNPNYLRAIGEELARTGLDVIHKTTRSYLLRIMDNLEEVEGSIAKHPDPDRLNHPRTIWKAHENTVRYAALGDGADADDHDEVEYWGEQPRHEGDEKGDDDGKDDHDDGEDGEHGKDEDDADDKDEDGEHEGETGDNDDDTGKDDNETCDGGDAGETGHDNDGEAGNDDQDDDDDIFEKRIIAADTIVRTLENDYEPQEAAYILANALTQILNEINDDALTRFVGERLCGVLGWQAASVANTERITDLEWKLASATTEREALRMENTNLKIENGALRKWTEQLNSAAPVPKPESPVPAADDPVTTTVPRHTFKRALKRARNNLRKVKIAPE